MSSIYRPVGTDHQSREPARIALDASRYSMQPSVLATMLHERSDDDDDALDVPNDPGQSSGGNTPPPVPPVPRIALQPPRTSSSAPPPHGGTSLRQLHLDPAWREAHKPKQPSPPSSPLPEPPSTPARQTGPTATSHPPPPTTPVAARVSTPYPRPDPMSVPMQRTPVQFGSTLARRRGVRLEAAQVPLPASPTQSDTVPGDVVLEVFGPGQTLLARVRYVGGQP